VYILENNFPPRGKKATSADVKKRGKKGRKKCERERGKLKLKG
jgi:hypothetical protein